jgi:hypothetical protein
MRFKKRKMNKYWCNQIKITESKIQCLSAENEKSEDMQSERKQSSNSYEYPWMSEFIVNLNSFWNIHLLIELTLIWDETFYICMEWIRWLMWSISDWYVSSFRRSYNSHNYIYIDVYICTIHCNSLDNDGNHISWLAS